MEGYNFFFTNFWKDRYVKTLQRGKKREFKRADIWPVSQDKEAKPNTQKEEQESSMESVNDLLLPAPNATLCNLGNKNPTFPNSFCSPMVNLNRIGNHRIIEVGRATYFFLPIRFLFLFPLFLSSDSAFPPWAAQKTLVYGAWSGRRRWVEGGREEQLGLFITAASGESNPFSLADSVFSLS